MLLFSVNDLENKEDVLASCDELISIPYYISRGFNLLLCPVKEHGAQVISTIPTVPYIFEYGDGRCKIAIIILYILVLC